MTPSARLMGLALTAALLGTVVPAKADVTADLDQCLADPTKTQTVFTERFPHESCELGSTCDPKLVQSAATLARERCRVAAIDTCADAPACAEALAQRWQGLAESLHADITARWEAVDRSKVSPFAIRRFDNRLKDALDTTCPDVSPLAAVSDLPEDTICQFYVAFANISRMEGLSNYLADQEARP